jgi:hypothetical protein
MSDHPDIGALLAHVGPSLFQQAYVVADRAAAEAAMEPLGATKFVRLETGDLDYVVRGRNVSCALDLSFARAGNVQIEIIQPVRGEGLHVEFLEQHGSGPHHIGAIVDSLDETLEIARAAGFDAAMRGDMGSVRFAYLDTFAVLGLYVETLEDPEGLIPMLMPWRDDQPGATQS